MDKILKIVFSKKSSSKSIEEALRLSKKLDGVVELDTVNIELSALEIFNLWELVNALLNVVDKWKSFEIYYRGRLCVVNKNYRALFYAIQDIRYCYFAKQDNPVDFEKCNPGWGCDKLNMISLDLTGHNKKWFEFGQLDPGGHTWTVDKLKILNELKTEMEIKYLTVCPAFPLNRIYKVLSNIQDVILLGEEWVAEWTNELVDGKLTKVYYLKYDREFEADCNALEKAINSIPERVECPHKVGSDAWLDWMTAKGYLKPDN